MTFRGQKALWNSKFEWPKSHLSTVKARRSKSFFAFSGEIAALIDRFKMAKIQYSVELERYNISIHPPCKSVRTLTDQGVSVVTFFPSSSTYLNLIGTKHFPVRRKKNSTGCSSIQNFCKLKAKIIVRSNAVKHALLTEVNWGHLKLDGVKLFLTFFSIIVKVEFSFPILLNSLK